MKHIAAEKLSPLSALFRCALTAALLTNATPAASGVTFQRVYSLQPGDDVFAYARISGSGRYLVFAATPPPNRLTKDLLRRRPQGRGYLVLERLQVVDLETQQILLQEAGVDGFWSNDEQRLIYLSHLGETDRVSIWHRETGEITRDVAPVELGTYFSWGERRGKDVILTILNNFYYLNGDRAVLPPHRVQPCDGLGSGERPLIDRAARRITTFVDGFVEVRNLTDCRQTLNTGIRGAKADFSWDGRYVAFHAPKEDGQQGYSIRIVDTRRRTVRNITELEGSALFPSWTRDGRLCFRYESEDYGGFLIANHVLHIPEQPLPTPHATPRSAAWSELFPESELPPQEILMVLVWANWSAYSSTALIEMQQASEEWIENRSVAFFTATDTSTPREAIPLYRSTYDLSLPHIPMSAESFARSDAANQIPATLMFRKGRLVDRRLGAQTAKQLKEWIASAETN